MQGVQRYMHILLMAMRTPPLPITVHVRTYLTVDDATFILLYTYVHRADKQTAVGTVRTVQHICTPVHQYRYKRDSVGDNNKSMSLTSPDLARPFNNYNRKHKSKTYLALAVRTIVCIRAKITPVT